MIQHTIEGQAYVVGDDVDTDQIIPAEHLYLNTADPEERKYFGMHAMSGVPNGQSGLPDGTIRFVEPEQFDTPFTIVIGGRNFGCGSSREHAPLAIAEAGAKVVIAEFYARIFYRNCVNGGYLLPCETAVRLVDRIATGDPCRVELDDIPRLTHLPSNETLDLQPLGDVAPIVEAGGIFRYAMQNGMID